MNGRNYGITLIKVEELYQSNRSVKRSVDICPQFRSNDNAFLYYYSLISYKNITELHKKMRNPIKHNKSKKKLVKNLKNPKKIITK